mgnify:FL=1
MTLLPTHRLRTDGMFAILVPATLLPLIVTLLWAERKAKTLGYVKKSTSEKSVVAKVYSSLNKLDVVGLAVIGTSVALILLPLTLAKTAKNGWKNRMSCFDEARVDADSWCF